MPRKKMKRSGTVVVDANFLLIPIIDNHQSHNSLKCVAIEFDERDGSGHRNILGFFIKESGGNIEYYGDKMDQVDVLLWCFYPYANLNAAERENEENWLGRDEESLKSIKRQLRKNIKLVKKLEKEKKI